MKFAIATQLFLAAVAMADNCTPGLTYCGSTLLRKGNYQAQINQAVLSAGQPLTSGGDNDLFFCKGGSNGDINWMKHCGTGCIDGGSNQDDHC